MKIPLIIVATSISQAVANPLVNATPRTLTSERITLDITPDMAYTMIELWKKIQLDIDDARKKMSEKNKEASSIRNIITNISKTDPEYKKHWDEVRKKFKHTKTTYDPPPITLPPVSTMARKIRQPSYVKADINQDLTKLPDFNLGLLKRDVSLALNEEDQFLKGQLRQGKNVDIKRQQHLQYIDFYDKIISEIDRRKSIGPVSNSDNEVPVALDE